MDSKLQIISGTYRGRKLHLPGGARPTQNRARIALFNMISSLGITPRVVWDAFAGSGAFGLECLSRWDSANVIFTDPAPHTVRKNLEMLNIGVRGRVLQTDAISAIGQYGAMADLVFLDPPYAAADLGRAFVRKLAAVARPGTILIWEQDAANFTAPDENAWEILRDKQYGRARFLILRRGDE